MVCLLVLGLIVGAFTLNASEDKSDPVARFRDAVKHVDRLVITPSTMIAPDSKIRLNDVLFEVKGQAEIGSLAQCIEIGTVSPMPCLCDGTHRLNFYSGPRFKFSLTFHHWSRLRGGLGGPWGGDAVLTDSSSDRLIEWFSQHGFDDFKAAKATVDQWIKDREQRRAEVAALLPEAVRQWVPPLDHNRSFGQEADQHSAALTELYVDKSELLLTVWRALGLMADWTGDGSLYPFGEPGGFLLKSLEPVTSGDLAKALAQLPQSDRHVWLGACRHLATAVQVEQRRAEWDEDWLVRLAEYYITAGPEDHGPEVVRLLDGLATADARALLLKIGMAATPALDPSDELRYGYWRSDAEVRALFHLGEARYLPVKSVLFEKLTNAPAGTYRLVLEIAAACFEERPDIRPEHLKCEADYGDAAELAWKLLHASDTNRPELELLIAAAQSPSYKVRGEAEAILAGLGLKVIDPEELTLDFENVVDASLEGRDAIIATSALLTENPGLVQKAVLQTRRGLAHLSMGDFEAAWLDLGEQNNIAPAYECAIAAFASGRFALAWNVAFHQIREGKDMMKFLRLRGAVNFAVGSLRDAYDDFTAAHAVGSSATDMALSHVTLLLMDQVDRSRVWEWEPFALLDDSSDYGTDLGSQYLIWPDALMLYLQGKITEPDMLRSAGAASRHEVGSQISLARWVLSQQARAKNDLVAERRELDACIAANAYTSVTHALALARLQTLREKEADQAEIVGNR